MFSKQQMGSVSLVVAGACTSSCMPVSALMGDPACQASDEAMVGPNRRCSEGTDCITPSQGRSCFEKYPDELNSEEVPDLCVS